MERTFLNGRVQIICGDITTLRVDAIVNAANASLMGGGGVDGAIHRAGGPKILEACREIRRTQYPQGLPAGDAVATDGGDLPARYVIHTVGPIWEARKDQSGLLASCYRRCLDVAAELGCARVGFPAISTGVYGYPKSDAARVASITIEQGLKVREIERVYLVFYRREDAIAFVENQRFGEV